MQNFCISPVVIISLLEEGSPGHRRGERGGVEDAPLLCPAQGLTAPAHLTGFGQVGALLNACAFGRPQRPFCSFKRTKRVFNSTNTQDVNNPDNAVALRLITHSIAESATTSKEIATGEDVCVCIPQLV